MATENTGLAENEERTVSFQRSIYDPGYVNAMSHFYRGEMGRIMVWRQRLDVTTNWAITSPFLIETDPPPAFIFNPFNTTTGLKEDK